MFKLANLNLFCSPMREETNAQVLVNVMHASYWSITEITLFIKISFNQNGDFGKAVKENNLLKDITDSLIPLFN